jgi:quinol monooxygenase YgiN
MVIVIGTFGVQAQDRDAYIANRIAVMEHSRAEHGCITYTFTADPIQPDVVVLTERWTDRPSLDAHIAGLKSAPQPAATPKEFSREIYVYQADEGQRL